MLSHSLIKTNVKNSCYLGRSSRKCHSGGGGGGGGCFYTVLAGISPRQSPQFNITYGSSIRFFLNRYGILGWLLCDGLVSVHSKSFMSLNPTDVLKKYSSYLSHSLKMELEKLIYYRRFDLFSMAGTNNYYLSEGCTWTWTGAACSQLLLCGRTCVINRIGFHLETLFRRKGEQKRMCGTAMGRGRTPV